jgi:hypothetical protein
MNKKLLTVTKVDHICLKPEPGAQLHHALRDAAALALDEQCDVLVNHNDRIYRAAYNDLIQSVQHENPDTDA